MEEIRLCDSEYRFVQVVWEAAPVPSGQLAELCRQRLGWKKSTVYTVRKKMCEKGLVQNENALVTVLVPRERVAAPEAEQVVDRTFGGSLPGFLAAFMSGKKLTAREAEEMKRLIDRYREE